MRHRMVRQVLFAAFVLIGQSATAFAHAFPHHSEPPVGGTVTQSPAEVRIWFSEKLEPTFSSASVTDGNGTRVDQGDGKVDSQDATLLRVLLNKLPPGTYKVVWHVVSVDTHSTQGDFTFTVSG